MTFSLSLSLNFPFKIVFNPTLIFKDAEQCVAHLVLGLQGEQMLPRTNIAAFIA